MKTRQRRAALRSPYLTAPPDQDSMDMEMMKQLGLFNDPLAELAGLAQINSNIQEPGQRQQQIDLQRSAQDIGISQFAQTQDLNKLKLQQDKESEHMLDERWTRDFALKKALGDQEHADRVSALTAGLDEATQRSIFGLFSLIPDFAAAGVQSDPNALRPFLDKVRPGLGGFLGLAADKESKARTSIELSLEQARKRKGL